MSAACAAERRAFQPASCHAPPVADLCLVRRMLAFRVNDTFSRALREAARVQSLQLHASGEFKRLFQS